MGKYREVEIAGNMTAFGIEIESRAGKVDEICEMLKFAKEVASKNLDVHIKSVFYDSKGSVCTFEFYSEIEQHTYEGQAIYQCASKYISRFMMFDSEYYD
ncbi:hypothetical protein [Vibrio sp. TRT 17S01]|uniref:hypothetical protein n=1 Tax=Vibrio sp. TRT 17S01 TaxID=3418505 RepID=UPI003CEB2F10